MSKIFSIVNKNKIFLLLMLLVIPAYVALIRPGYFFMQDDMQAFRIQQMDKCIQDGQIPCRWVPDAGYQYGYPEFNYYPPSVYYLGEALHLLGVQFIDAVKILFILGYILSAATMFVLLRAWLGEYPALIGAVLYTYTPYKAVEVYLRGALSEFWSLVFFPLIFWASFQLIKQGKSRYLIWLAISIGLLLTTHNLMSMIFMPLVAIWILIWLILNKAWFRIPQLVIGGVLGLGLASFFTLPVLFERQYAHLETLLGGYFDYRQHFVDLNQLFISNHWGYGSSELGPGDDMSLSTGNVLWVGAVLSTVLALLAIKKNKVVSLVSLALGATVLVVLFMVHQKSSFIWAQIPQLWYLQFPWRFLTDSIFLLSILSAVAIYLAKIKFNTRVSVSLGILLILATFILHHSFFQPKEWYNITDQDKFSGVLWQKELTISIFDYLPIYAKLPPNHAAPAVPEILDGQAQFVSYQKGSDFQTGRIQVEQAATVRFPLFDFPGMKVFLDGQEINHHHYDCRNEEYCLGLITTLVPTGTHTLIVRLTNTPIRLFGNIISIISIIIILYLVFGWRYVHKVKS
ncbi:6-pyruvoyl-tetrahydropterin synthase-related protein [Patescibacteria group bacterium]|nr:6-pyruvoyl-tetrahydropterin synthase-related protein [Patescibacteria group bacterium]MCL5409622.1 6-pyruvoyl-tetrahydropterin synthase-related protein [Patescibacteria group bacterium]